MKKEALLIFAKNPIYGQVKTRLAASIGKETALAVYKQLLQHTLFITEYLPIHKILFYSAYLDEHDHWNSNFFEKKVQKGADLGERMKNAFTYAFQNGFEKAVIIGTDCPELDAGLIMNAFSYLNRNDVLIGPAKDGGYYLLGMKKTHTFFFEDMEWSCNKVLEATISLCTKHNLQYELLPQLHDIDEEKDIVHLKAIKP